MDAQVAQENLSEGLSYFKLADSLFLNRMRCPQDFGPPFLGSTWGTSFDFILFNYHAALILLTQEAREAADNFGVSRFTLYYWKRKAEDRLFHGGTHGGARSSDNVSGIEIILTDFV